MAGTTPNRLADKVFTQNGDATPWFSPGLGKFNIMAVDSDQTLNATVVLQISVDGGVTPYTIETYTNVQTVKVGENWDPAAQYRLLLTAFTSATAGYLRLAA